MDAPREGWGPLWANSKDEGHLIPQGKCMGFLCPWLSNLLVHPQEVTAKVGVSLPIPRSKQEFSAQARRLTWAHQRGHGLLGPQKFTELPGFGKAQRPQKPSGTGRGGHSSKCPLTVVPSSYTTGR